MIVVYWLAYPEGDGLPQAHHRAFKSAELSTALKFAESLRAQRAAGDKISHVSIQSELTEAVGPAGVADPSPAYAHYKRRIDPAIPLGRPSGTAAPAAPNSKSGNGEP